MEGKGGGAAKQMPGLKDTQTALRLVLQAGDVGQVQATVVNYHPCGTPGWQREEQTPRFSPSEPG